MAISRREEKRDTLARPSRRPDGGEDGGKKLTSEPVEKKRKKKEREKGEGGRGSSGRVEKGRERE